MKWAPEKEMTPEQQWQPFLCLLQKRKFLMGPIDDMNHVPPDEINCFLVPNFYFPRAHLFVLVPKTTIAKFKILKLLFSFFSQDAKCRLKRRPKT